MYLKKIVIIFISHNSRVLMQLRDINKEIPHAGKWGYFSGGLNKGEDFVKGAKREIQEELKVKPKKLRYIFPYIHKKNRALYYVFLGKINIFDIKLSEGLDYDFFTKTDLFKKIKYSKKVKNNFLVADDETIHFFYNKLSRFI